MEIEQLLAARVGRDKARVSVTVETDREAETVTEKSIQPDSRVTISTDSEEISDTSSGSAGSVTVASNLPDGDANAADKRSSERPETRERSNYDYSEIQRQTVRQAGAIKKISVAVLIDGIIVVGADGQPNWEPRSIDEIAALRGLVIAAIGFDEARGDIVTIESLAFQPDATPGELVELARWSRFFEGNAMTLIQISVLALVAIVLAMTVVRPILTRPVRTPALAGGVGSSAQLANGSLEPSVLSQQIQSGSPAPAAGTERPGPDAEALRLAVADRPDQTISMLRDWLAPAEIAVGEVEVA